MKLNFLFPADGYSSSDSYTSDPEQMGNAVTRQRSVKHLKKKQVKGV